MTLSFLLTVVIWISFALFCYSVFSWLCAFWLCWFCLIQIRCRLRQSKPFTSCTWLWFWPFLHLLFPISNYFRLKWIFRWKRIPELTRKKSPTIFFKNYNSVKSGVVCGMENMGLIPITVLGSPHTFCVHDIIMQLLYDYSP